MPRAEAPALPLPLVTAVQAIRDLKGVDVQVLDLRGIADATDFFVIASGTSEGHVRGLGQKVLDALDASGWGSHHVEGLATGRWVLIDAVDVVVHLFHPDTRRFYQLERLWGDAPHVVVGSR
jgi:ribosome-associated protein